MWVESRFGFVFLFFFLGGGVGLGSLDLGVMPGQEGSWLRISGLWSVHGRIFFFFFFLGGGGRWLVAFGL